jgi:DNA repair ATPase RecN
MSKHPLALQRAVLVAALSQLHELVEEMTAKGKPTEPQERDLVRVHLRLLVCQDMCRKFGV